MILKNFFQPTDLFGRILKFDGVDIVEYKLIRYMDIVAGASYNFGDDSSGTLTFDFSSETLFWEIVELQKTTPILFETFRYENHETLGVNEYNLFYFPTKNNFIDDVAKNDKKYSMTFETIKFYEDLTIAEHNQEYDFESLPIDPNTNQPIIPYDYNKWYWNGTIEDAILEIWNDNIVTPVNRIKGEAHTPDNTRKFKGIGTISITDIGQPNVQATLEKQSVFKIREHLYNILKGQSDYQKHILEIKYNSSTKKLDLYFNHYDILTITNGETPDNYTYFSSLNDTSNDVVDVLVESAQQDNLSVREIVEPKTYEWKNKEGITSSGLDENGTTSTFSDTAISFATQQEVIKETNLTIEFANKEYFKDFKAGQVIELIGFQEQINGQYLIRRMSGVVNDSHVSFNIDDMEVLQ